MTDPRADGDPVRLVAGAVHRVLADPPDVPELTADRRLVDLGVSSMQTMQIVFEIEQVLDVEFPDSALVAPTFESIGSLAAVVGSLGPAAG